MIDETAASPSSALAPSVPSAALVELTGTAWSELPHFCTGLHNVPDTPDILIALLDDDHTRRARAVWDLYRLLLNEERVFPATAPAALVVSALLDDPRMLASGQWERRAGTRVLRAELLNWLASFADVARLGPEDGAGAPQDLAAARAARPTLHARVAAFCEDDDPQVRDAAVAAAALLLADPALAASIPGCAPVVRDVLARSADSYYRWIARERLEAWGEDIADLITAEEEHRAVVKRTHELAANPFDEGQEQAIRWLAEQPEDTAALKPPGRWHPDREAPGRTVSYEPVPDAPTAVRGSAPEHRGPWRIAWSEERDEWTFTPYIGVGPLHFGMTLEEITAALGEEGTVSSCYAPDTYERRLSYADFRTTGVRALFRMNRLECVAVNALTGPQVRLDGVPLTGCVPSQL